jgi:hypothetical protein
LLALGLGIERPFAATSFFNRPLPRDISPLELDPNSDAEIAQLSAFGGIAPLVIPAEPSAPDANVPVYDAAKGDPGYTIACPAGCALAGAVVHVPNGALLPRPDSGGAGPRVMAVIDAAGGNEVDLELQKLDPAATPANGSAPPLVIAAGGSGSLDGDGTAGFGVVHAGVAEALGLVRAGELLSGEVPHALRFSVACAGTQSVRGGSYPFAKIVTDAPCADSVAGAPFYGARLWLDLSDTEIAALTVPAYLKTIYTALAHYGAFLTGTRGCACATVFAAESPASATLLGRPNPWAALARAEGVPATGPPGRREYVFSLEPPSQSGLDLGAHLHVLAPCVTAQTC